MVAVQKGVYPVEFLSVYWFLSLPQKKGGKSLQPPVFFSAPYPKSPAVLKALYLGWNQKGFTVEPREMIRRRIFSEMIPFSARKSELQTKMTVGFLYGAGAETLIFVTGTSGKKSETFRLPAEKPKSAVDTQKTKKNRCLGIRCWDLNLSGGYQNCGLGIHPWEIFRNRSGKNSEFFSKV